MGLTRRTLHAAAWSTISNVLVNLISFVRSIFLARWLAIEVFGIYGYAAAITTIAAVLLDFGMGNAFIHRSEETVDEERAAKVHFTLKVVLGLAWTGPMVFLALWFSNGDLRLALLTLIGVRFISILVQTPELILLRRVVHRRLAIIRVVYTVLGTGIALVLAWYGWGVWSLLAIELISVTVRIFGLIVWRPVWRPRLGWAREVVNYYFRFGSRGLVANSLDMTLDRLDDLWAGRFLGQLSLGLYTRAYTFATYPRMVISASIGSVADGVYAELKEDRLRLSQAFTRTNAALVRVSFLVAGVLALVAPEFIRIVLGNKWMPMLVPFRLMLVFTMLDPLRGTVSSLFVAVGKPERLVQTRIIQLIVLITGLFYLGSIWDLAGIALAVDIMLLTGMIWLLWQARLYVDYSLRQLIATPMAGLFLGMSSARLSILSLPLLGLPVNDWTTGLAKSFVFVAVYGVVLFLFERERIWGMFHWIQDRIK